MRDWNWRAGERSNRAPGLVGWEMEFAFCPISERRNRWRRSNQTEIQLVVVHRRLAGITFGEKLEHDAISKIARQWNVRLKRDTLALGTWQQIAKSRDGRVASIAADDHASRESFPHDVDLPILRGGAIESNQRCFFANFSAERARAAEKKMIEQAALDCDLALIAAR